MGFKAIHDQNPFVVPGLFFAALLVLRAYFASRPGPWRPMALSFGRKSILGVSALLGICLILGPAFEMYFRVLECQVSQRYMKDNVEFAGKAMAVFAANRIPYWLDYATLLNEMRSQTLNAWEQDVDFSTIMPTHLQSLRNLPIQSNGETLAALIDEAKKNPSGPYPALTVEDLIKKFEKVGFDVAYEAHDGRMLLQLWGKQRSGPHIDVWMWAAVPESAKSSVIVGTPEPAATMWTKDSLPMLYSGEERLAYNPREWNHLFPLGNATWLGREVTTPNDKHAVSEGEFGHYGGSYMVAQVFRGDCFHNFFNLRFIY